MARRYLIGGRVQGVGFRYFTQRAAIHAGVGGWVRNLDDGRVEVHASGTVAQLDDFEAQVRMGPRGADVRSFESEEAAPTDSSDFRIR